MAEDRCARCGSTALSPAGVCTRCGERPRGSATRAAAPILPTGLPPSVARPRFIPPAPPVVTPPAPLPIESALPPRPSTPPPLPEPTAAETAGDDEGALEEARPFSWTWVWAAAGAVVVVAVALAGVATSWFGLAGSPSESTVASPTSTASSVVVDTSGVPSTEPPTTAATTVAGARETVPIATVCVVASEGRQVPARSEASDSARQEFPLPPNDPRIRTTGSAWRDENNKQWREIEYLGQMGWVESFFLSPGECTTRSGDQHWCVKEVTDCSGPKVRIGPEANSANIDDRLSDGYDVIDELDDGAVGIRGTGLMAHDYQDALWIQIWFDGGRGWVHGDYLTTACSPPPCG